MARKKAKKSKRAEKASYSPRFNGNLFLVLDKKIPKIPGRLAFALMFFLLSCLLLQNEVRKTDQRILGVRTQTKERREEIFRWEEILAEKPGYRDGWLQLAGLWADLGEREMTKDALAHAKALDPNNESILSLELLLTN